MFIKGKHTHHMLKKRPDYSESSINLSDVAFVVSALLLMQLSLRYQTSWWVNALWNLQKVDLSEHSSKFLCGLVPASTECLLRLRTLYLKTKMKQNHNPSGQPNSLDALPTKHLGSMQGLLSSDAQGVQAALVQLSRAFCPDNATSFCPGYISGSRLLSVLPSPSSYALDLPGHSITRSTCTRVFTCHLERCPGPSMHCVGGLPPRRLPPTSSSSELMEAFRGTWKEFTVISREPLLFDFFPFNL